jgi:hypothetical protein
LTRKTGSPAATSRHDNSSIVRAKEPTCRAADQPFHDRLDRVMDGPLRDRAFDHLRDDDIAAWDDQR